MKKNYIFILIIMLCLPLITKAEEIFVNNLGVEITQEEMEILQSKNYNLSSINKMDEYNINIILNSEVITSDTDYIRVDNTYDMNGNVLYQRSTSVSEEEYNNYNPENEVLPASVYQKHETTYKKIQSQIVKESTNVYYYTFEVIWKKMPANRSADIMAHRYTNVTDPMFYYVAYEYELPNGNTVSSSCNYIGGCTSKIRALNNGWVGGYELPTQEITGLSYFSSFDISKTSTSTTSYIYSTYQHSTSYVALGSALNTAYINSSGHGDVVSFGNVINDKFDQMQGVYLTF